MSTLLEDCEKFQWIQRFLLSFRAALASVILFFLKSYLLAKPGTVFENHANPNK